MKKLFLFLCLFMSAALMQIWGYDFSSNTGGQFPIDLYYTINADQKSVTVTQGPSSYTGTLIEIPATVTYQGKEYTVTTIGYQAFQQTKISEVIMPNTITEIESYAFNSSEVGNVTFSKNLKKIGDYAFNNTNLQHVELFDGLEAIGNWAFKCGDYRKGINTLNLPNSVSTIGSYAFAYNSFTFLKIPESIEKIETHAFDYCNKMDSVVLPSNLRIIDESAFANCFSIRYIKFPSTLIEIGESAFNGCMNLQSIVLPDNVLYVGNRAFEDCTNLVDFTFSAKMKEIPEHCLSYNSKLVNVTIPEGIEKIGLGAFDHCPLLSHVTFPESVTKLDEMIFTNSGITSITFPKKVTYLPGFLFSGCNKLQEIIIPDHIDSIGSGVFNSCVNLKKVQLPSNLKDIPKDLFNQCSNLEEISLPNQIESIGESAFYHCTNIKELNIPQSVLEIGRNAFQDMTSLKSIRLPENLKTISQWLLYGCSNLSSVYIPESVEEIQNSAFYLTALKEVTIPHSVRLYGKDLFGKCKYLTALHIQRTTPPIVTGMGMNPSIIDEDSQCILYVPKGSKATWDAADPQVWGRFKEIVEEDVPDVLYAIQIKKEGSGTIKINSEEISSSQSVEVAMGSEATVSFEPSVGYMLKSVYCNGKDVTDQVNNLTYTITDIQENLALEIIFAEAPLSLEIQTAQGGVVCVPVEKNHTFTCKIVPEKGWSLHSAYYNGLDVTDQINEEGMYTTPKVTYDSRLNVTFELSTDVQNQTANSIKVHVDNQGNALVEGLQNGMMISLFNTNGNTLETCRANQPCKSIQLPGKGIYLLKVDTRTFKVSY